jgi:hypothetical protein
MKGARTMSNNQNNSSQQPEDRKGPVYIAKVRDGYGKKASYEQIGAAWINDNGSIYVKLHGKQIVDQPFTLYPIDRDQNGA